MLASMACMLGGLAPTKLLAQQPRVRYPLHVESPNSTPAPKASVKASQPLSASLNTTRSEFADQFEAAYQNLIKAPGVRVASHIDLGAESVEPSIVDFSANEEAAKKLRQDNGKDDLASPVVTHLPVLHPTDVTNRFPRVASAPQPAAVMGDRQPLVSAAVDNDFLVTRMPPLPNGRYNLHASDTMNGSTPPAGADTPDQPDVTSNWWTSLVQQPLHPTNQTQPIDTNTLVYLALENSPRIQALSHDPLIRDFEVVEADTAFDPVAFLQTQFADRSDPLGGRLDATRDGADTIENHNWTAEGGVRKRARTGATYELSQRLGFQNSNVAVFDPNNQGTSQLALNVTQPLGRGRGRYINQSQILIAQSRGGAAWESFAAQLQEEIESVVAAYWRLYYDRSVFLQKKRNVERVAEILAMLEGRAGLDSLPSQITRARSALQSRKTELANAFRDVRNSETELRRLIADRNWLSNQQIELLPAEAPIDTPLQLSISHVVTTALNNRAEIRETMQQAKIAGIEKDISVNELLPELSFLVGTYVSALQDDGHFDRAFVDQFGEIKPGYSVGLEFEMPIRNRAARSRLVQRKLQLAKIKNQVDEAMQNVIAESQTALRRVDSAAETLLAARQAIEAAQSDLDQNLRRWESFSLIEGDFADGQTPTTVLDQLLDSQERLAAAELVAAQSQMEQKISEVALQRAMGTLLIQKDLNPQRTFECGLPKIKY